MLDTAQEPLSPELLLSFHEVLKQGTEQAASDPIFAPGVFKAVSYTHLDVYKRQDQNRSAHLSRILNSYPGRDGVVLFVQQADGRRFRAELPVSVDAQSTVLKAEIRDLFGPEAMIA